MVLIKSLSVPGCNTTKCDKVQAGVNNYARHCRYQTPNDAVMLSLGIYHRNRYRQRNGGRHVIRTRHWLRASPSSPSKSPGSHSRRLFLFRNLPLQTILSSLKLHCHVHVIFKYTIHFSSLVIFTGPIRLFSYGSCVFLFNSIFFFYT